MNRRKYTIENRLINIDSNNVVTHTLQGPESAVGIGLDILLPTYTIEEFPLLFYFRH
ncbi:MAG: hypothetical protein U0T56_02970 [Ferruginibacter sp.]